MTGGGSDGGGDGSSVRVAVRIRPQLPREIIDACKICITKTPGEPQTWLGSNKAFTFDHVYDTESSQQDIYQETVDDLIEGCFEGYNATVLAYGQTGSGKTYTMGTGFEVGGVGGGGEKEGIIPRAVHQLFRGIETRQAQAKESGRVPPEFKVTAQFMELYNEEILDLFENSSNFQAAKNKKSGIRVHEDMNGNIYTVGVTNRTVRTEAETMNCLKSGAFNRTTGSTNMNDASSRSHAIFTLYVQQQREARVENPFHLEDDRGGGADNDEKDDGQSLPSASPSLPPAPGSSKPGELEMLTAKFHFVDLAGSERLKRTGATGDRAKEGISINCGLLALGNVISALGDTSRRVSHVPYRDSKLTRLLQDSLGGNSRTLMIACVSPSDRDFMETLNSLKYANRARNIKNKVTANQDKTSRTIMMLRQEIQNLQLELVEYKQGKRIVDVDGVETTNDMYHENAMLSKENGNLRTRVKALQETIDVLTAKNAQLIAEKEVGEWIVAANGSAGGSDVVATADMAAMVEKYVREIEELRTKLCSSEHLGEQLRKETARAKRLSASFSPAKISWTGMAGLLAGGGGGGGGDGAAAVTGVVDEDSGYSVQELIAIAKKDLEKNKERQKRKRSSKVTDADKDINSADDEGDEDSDGDGGEDEAHADEADEEDSDTDTEESDGNKTGAEFDEELVELTSEISLKQKLIEELETSQKRLEMMKLQYESKLTVLQHKIVATEEERDKVLKNMGAAKGVVPPEKVDGIKKQYQEKLSKLQSEVKKLQTAQKEHTKLLRNQSQYQRQVEKLRAEVTDMERNKVRLVQKMKEESNRHRETETRKNRELAQMKKVTRKNESLIKNLEAEKRMKEGILKRKTEEVSLLRRNQRRISAGAAGKRGGSAEKNSARAAKQKWSTVEKKITKIALNKQAVSQMENDMDRWLKEREKLSHKLEKLALKRMRLAATAGDDAAIVEDLDDQIENLKAGVNYLHENIVDCQANIMQMEQVEEAATDGDMADEEQVAKVINIQELSLDEAKYLMEKLLSMTINQCCLATQKDCAIREMENRMSQAHKQNTLHQQLLHHMIEQQDLEVYDLMLMNENEDDSSNSDSDDLRPSTVAAASALPLAATAAAAAVASNVQQLAGIDIDDVGSDSSLGRREKARRKMTTKADLLFNDTDVAGGVGAAAVAAAAAADVSNGPSSSRAASKAPPRPPPMPLIRSLSFTKDAANDLLTRSKSFTKTSNGNFIPGGRNNSTNLMTQSVDHNAFIRQLSAVHQPSPVLGRRSLDRPALGRPTSPRSAAHKFGGSAARLAAESVAEYGGGASPPGSPPGLRRQGSSRDESGTGQNVFHRLTAGTNIGASPKPDKGTIHPYQGRIGPKSPLICSNVAEGHNKAVLSVFATDDVLLSGSKDRTVKVWDLCRKEEIASLGGHPNNVVVVKFSSASRLAFTVSSAFIKVWDLRLSAAACIKTLSSSGLTTNGSVQLNSAARTLAMPPGETTINDIALTDSGYTLFSAAADKVRMWDLRKFHSIGKLSGGHQAAVMCLTTGSASGGGGCEGSYVITGSKDHYIKVFEVQEGKGGVIAPNIALDPPHYDGIECLALSGYTLFSASRDTCIKKWDLRAAAAAEAPLVKSMNNAHKDWICGLAFLPDRPIIVSGCRAGYIKLWSTATCGLVGEMKAHNSTINTLTTNSSHLFTGSNDGSIGMWRVRSNYDRSPDSDSAS